MKMQQVLYALLFLGYCQAVFAVDAPPAAKNLPDPTAHTDRLKQELGGVNLDALRKNTGSVKKPTGVIEDPTQMNENFRSALNRVRKIKPGVQTGSTSIAPALVMPDIKVLAIAIHTHDQHKHHVMLSVDGKNAMLGKGEKYTSFKNNQLIEIELLEIVKNQVKLKLSPGNEIIILH